VRVKLLRSFSVRAQKNVANLLSLNAVCHTIIPFFYHLRYIYMLPDHAEMLFSPPALASASPAGIAKAIPPLLAYGGI
jgi:hypothetical protein